MTHPQKNLGEPSVPALMALADAGLIAVEWCQDSRLGTFYLASNAERALEELRAQLGQPTPLSEAEQRVAGLEKRLTRIDAITGRALR